MAQRRRLALTERCAVHVDRVAALVDQFEHLAVERHARVQARDVAAGIGQHEPVAVGAADRAAGGIEAGFDRLGRGSPVEGRDAQGQHGVSRSM